MPSDRYVEDRREASIVNGQDFLGRPREIRTEFRVGPIRRTECRHQSYHCKRIERCDRWYFHRLEKAWERRRVDPILPYLTRSAFRRVACLSESRRINLAACRCSEKESFSNANGIMEKFGRSKEGRWRWKKRRWNGRSLTFCVLGLLSCLWLYNNSAKMILPILISVFFLTRQILGMLCLLLSNLSWPATTRLRNFLNYPKK